LAKKRRFLPIALQNGLSDGLKLSTFGTLLKGFSSAKLNFDEKVVKMWQK
tara:strand:- start:162 stop:311 length:150 start_codon:yes stop_codon:yes gene_type:complete